MENNESSLWEIYQSVVLTPLRQQKTGSITMLLSVWNANGVKRTRLQNRLLARKVTKHLARKGIKYYQVWGGSESMDYRELTLVFQVKNLSQIERFAEFAEQNAFYFVKRGQLYLANTRVNQKALKLGQLKEHTKRYSTRLLMLGKNQAVAE